MVTVTAVWIKVDFLCGLLVLRLERDAFYHVIGNFKILLKGKTSFGALSDEMFAWQSRG